MKILSAFVFVCFVGLMISCQMVLDIELPEQPSKLVVNAVITTDCVMNIGVLQSAGILDTTGIQFEPIGNATVTVSDEQGNQMSLESFIDKYNYYGPRYRSKNIPLPGKIYSLRVDVPGFESVEAKTRMPDLVNNIQASFDSLNSSPNSLIFNIKFSDDPTQRNYYETYYIEKVKTTNTYYINDQYETRIDTMWFRTRLYYEYTDHMDYKSLFSDLYCNHECSLKGFTKQFYDYGGEILEAKIEILNINPEYYDYLTTSHLQGDSYDDPTAQPVQAYNNIKNGYGIFSGFSKTYFTLK